MVLLYLEPNFNALKGLALPRTSHSGGVRRDRPVGLTPLADYAVNCTSPFCARLFIVTSLTVESWSIGYECLSCVLLLQLQ